MESVDMLFWHPVAGYLVAVWGKEAAAIGSMSALEILWGTLQDSFGAEWIGVIGPGAGHMVRLFNRTLVWTTAGFEWHTDPTHAQHLLELLGLESCNSRAVPGRKGSGSELFNRTLAMTCDSGDALTGMEKSTFISATSSLMCHVDDRPDVQYSASRVMANVPAPTQKGLVALKQIGRYLVDKQECKWEFKYQEWPKEILVVTDDETETDVDGKRSIACVHLFFGRCLLESSTSTQQVVGLTSSEHEYHGLLRGAEVGLQLRAVLTELGYQLIVKCLIDSSGVSEIAKRSGSDRVQQQDTRHLWFQERHRLGEVGVGVVTTSHNTSGLGTRHQGKKRLQELMEMLPVIVGMSLLAPRGAEGNVQEGISVLAYRRDCSNSGGENTLMWCTTLMAVFVAGLSLGWFLGRRQAPVRDCDRGQHAEGEEETMLESEQEERRTAERGKVYYEYQTAKMRMLVYPAEQLRRACVRVGFHAGTGATKEAMARGLCAEHGYTLDTLEKANGGLLGRIAGELATESRAQPLCSMSAGTSSSAQSQRMTGTDVGVYQRRG